MVLRKLVLSNLLVHRVRAILTIAAIALSVSLVVSVSTGYSSAQGAAKKLLSQYMSTCDLQVTRSKGDPHGSFPDSIAKDLAGDPQAVAALGRYESESMLLDAQGKRVAGHPVFVNGIKRPEDQNVDNLEIEKGAWFETDDGNLAVVDQVLAQKLKLEVGGTITLAGTDHSLPLKVTGIVHKPAILAAEQQEIYVPLKTLQRFFGRPGRINRVLVTLKPGSDADAFKARWEPQIQKTDPLVAMKSAGDLHKQLEHNMSGLRFLSYLGGAVSMLAATFIVFSALSMGVGERQRTLAMLRAIGAFKSQLAKMVIVEGLLLSIVGVMIGVPLGILWVKMLATWKSDIFVAGVVVDWVGVAYGSGGAILTALAAGLLPAWSATRVDPLEAMNPLAKPPRAGLPIWPTVAGLACISIDPTLIFTHTSPTVKFYGHFIAGLPGMMLGFFLLAPLFVWTFEKLFGWLAAKLLGVQPTLLRQQLSSGIWRAAGTCSALMVGLAILVVMQTEGHSMMAGWRLPNKFPDVFIVSFEGLDPRQQAKLEKTPGIKPNELMPIAISAAVVSNENIDATGANFIPQAAMFFGIDPDKAANMIELEFRDDNGVAYPAAMQPKMMRQACDELKLGHHIIVTEEYRRLLGKKKGDKLTLQTPLHGNVEYTIAGIVWSPGIEVIVTMFDMDRQFDQRTASSIFGSLKDARDDFGITDATMFAANLEYGVDKKKLQGTMEREAKEAEEEPEPKPAPTTAPVVAATSQPAQRDGSFIGGAMNWMGLGPKSPPAGTQPASKRSAVRGLKDLLNLSGMQVGDVRHIKYQITHGFDRILLVLSTVAFASMAVAALGVTNTIMASIRSRRWQFGVLRSIGVTRSQLLRLVLAEALLLAITSCALGLVAGFLMSMDANGLSASVLGYVVPLTPPWGIILIGTLIVLGTAMLASLWPAISVARDEPLALLQAGRAAA